MLTLLRAIRKKLQEIRYYSAALPTGGWSRAADAALLAGLLAAVPLSWTLDRAVAESRIQARVRGKLFTITDGSTWASTSASLSPQLVPQGAMPSGSFDAVLETQRRGWPFASSTSGLRPRLTVQLFNPTRTLTAADLPPGSALRETIASARANDADDPVLERLRDPAGEARVRAHWRGWVGNTMIWGVLLPIAAWALVGVARIFWLPVQRRRLERSVDRTRSGRCATCGYDLRGNPLGGHCPECGSVL